MFRILHIPTNTLLHRNLLSADKRQFINPYLFDATFSTSNRKHLHLSSYGTEQHAMAELNNYLVHHESFRLLSEKYEISPKKVLSIEEFEIVEF